MVGILYIGDLKYCPYLKKYIDIFDKYNVKYEVLYWDREASKKERADNYISYVKKSKLNKSIYSKCFDFLGYRNWLNKKIKEKKYEKLIILSTLTGIITFEVLLNKYKKKYIFDIRDYSYENNKIFSFIEKKIIKNSYFTSISSEGFKNFLPRELKYYIVHNFNRIDIKEEAYFKRKKEGQTLNLMWMGSVRYFNHQKKIIDNLKNDSRFNLIYHGSGPEFEEYINYCKKNKIYNVQFTGEYDNNKKNELIEKADIINNSYLTSKFQEVQFAISNRYYDGIIYRIPQLVEENTYKSLKVVSEQSGIALNPNDKEFANKLYDYYYSINGNKFNNTCIKEVNKVLSEDTAYISKIITFLNM